MRVRMFKPQFAPLVLDGTKRQTIRPLPKRMPQAGDLESWREWTGRPYRSPQGELVQVRIISAQTITITLEGVMVGEKVLTLAEEISLAKRDGFIGRKDFIGWFNFTHGLPFTGILIKAENL